jgi:hypothetical protein
MAFYSHIRLGTDQSVASARFTHVGVLLTRRHDIAGEMLDTIRARRSAAGEDLDFAVIESSLATARQALGQVEGLPTPSQAARMSEAEADLQEAIRGFTGHPEASRIMAGEVGYQNRIRDWERVNEALPPALTAYDELARVYQSRRATFWIQPFANWFDYPAVGRLRL